MHLLDCGNMPVSQNPLLCGFCEERIFLLKGVKVALILPPALQASWGPLNCWAAGAWILSTISSWGQGQGLTTSHSFPCPFLLLPPQWEHVLNKGSSSNKNENTDSRYNNGIDNNLSCCIPGKGRPNAGFALERRINDMFGIDFAGV